jgi:hypothetical protein
LSLHRAGWIQPAHKKNPCRWAEATRVLGTGKENWTDRNGKSSLARSGVALSGLDAHQLGPQGALWMRRSRLSKDRTTDGNVNTIIDQFPVRTVRPAETKFSFFKKGDTKSTKQIETERIKPPLLK